MEFLNPLALFFSLSMASMNLYHLDDPMAETLSTQYIIENRNEGLQVYRCPDSFNLDMTSTNSPGTFFLKRKSHFQHVNAEPRLLVVDGTTRMLHDGEIVKASLADNRSIQIEVFNETLPQEKIVETMTFNQDGSLTYKASLQDDRLSKPEIICPETTYSKS
ncbi:MAG: hypothetical protein HRT44_12830 [Bdellovibrionales bacterium]|nr:hypothetical protein [Bdellovibrionales bacterium]NQZ20121.1 hypothetical protein [Bdellovibrionales bacterium]